MANSAENNTRYTIVKKSIENSHKIILQTKLQLLETQLNVESELDANEYTNMLVTFRVSELQMLLGFAGRNKTGRKNELQQRALELLRVRSHPIQQKIRDLYKTIQFPKDENIKNVWFNVLKSRSIECPINSKFLYACSIHFEESCFHISFRRKCLRKEAIPTLHLGLLTGQSGGLNNVSPASSSPGSNDLANNIMPQPQGAVPRTTATVHPYNVNNQQIAGRQPPMYNQNIYAPYPQYQKPQQSLISNNYPIHPDVKFRRLPFFDILGDLLKPSTLVPQATQRMQEGSFYFHLTPQQATDIASSRDIRPGVKCDYIKQVQMRFCLLETTCEQEDYFPPNVIVKVNNKLTQLPNPIPTNKPGVEPKRPPKPVNITSLVKLSPTVPNTITVSWAADYGRGYAITVALVHKLTSSDLLLRLKTKGAKHSDHTTGLIKEKLNDDDCEIATTCLRVSLLCPLGKMRMTTPCRAITCSHLQCFDAHLFLQMNERKPTWSCPVCDKPALYDNLVIDGYFLEVLTSTNLPSDANEIQLHKDGSWSTQNAEKKVQKTEKAEIADISIEIINDDVEFVSSNTTATSSTDIPKEVAKDEPPVKKDVVDLTASDSDDDEPLAKRRAVNPKPDSTIKFSDTTSISSNSNQSRVTTTPGPSSVSSSGYPASPAIITLDSPSPPRSPQPTTPNHNQQPASCMLAATNGNPGQATPVFNPNMSFMDLESETNNGTMSYHTF